MDVCVAYKVLLGIDSSPSWSSSLPVVPFTPVWTVELVVKGSFLHRFSVSSRFGFTSPRTKTIAYLRRDRGKSPARCSRVSVSCSSGPTAIDFTRRKTPSSWTRDGRVVIQVGSSQHAMYATISTLRSPLVEHLSGVPDALPSSPPCSLDLSVRQDHTFMWGQATVDASAVTFRNGDHFWTPVTTYMLCGCLHNAR